MKPVPKRETGRVFPRGSAMPLKSSLAFLLAASVALPATAAFAADYEPPVFVDEAPEYTPVEVGSGWYLRGDVAYQPDDGYGYDEDFVNFRGSYGPIRYSEEENQFSGSIGVGYHWTDWLRTDVNVGLFAGNDVDASYTTSDFQDRFEANNDAWYGMANVYADLGTVAGFTPYVGAGLGVLRTKWDANASFTDAFGTFEIGAQERAYSMAYTLNAGVAYALGGNVSLDVGYQYFNSPDAEYVRLGGSDTFEKQEGLEFQQIRAGLRYDLW